MFGSGKKAAAGQGQIVAPATGWQPSVRLQQLLDDHNHATAAVGLERALHYTEFHKQNAGQIQSPHLLNAHCLAHHLRQRSIRIYDQEWLVGTHTEHRIGAICQVERSGVAMLEDILNFEKRDINPLHIDPKLRWKVIRSVIPYWLNRNLAARAFEGGQKIKGLKSLGRTDQFIATEAGGIAHFIPDYGMLVSTGTLELRNQVRSRLADPELTPSQTDYLNANLVVLDALDEFADRYLKLAAESGRLDLVQVLKQVPRYPAKNLQQALQAIWFFQLIIQIESMDQGISLGRIDQYLYPLVQLEMEQGDFNADTTRELIAAFCIKLSEVIPLFSTRITPFFSGLPSGQALTLGGTDASGQDASNKLTHLFLDVLESIKTRQPNWHARINHQSAPDYLTRVFELITAGGGSPALYNDDAIMPALGRRQAPADLLWNYATVGCVEPALPGISLTSTDAALVNLAINLEFVLGGGKPLQRSTRKRRPYLDAIQCMDDLLDRLQEQVDTQIDQLKNTLDHLEVANTRYFPTPFSSLTVQGCLASATDLTAGGALCNGSGIQGVGVADLADSLAVINALVFTNNQYSLEEIANACASNFNNRALLRAQALKISKFGNDDSTTDRFMARVTEIFDRSVSRYTNTRGGPWVPGFYSMTCHRGFGELTSALPSGRLAGEALADGLAPVDGCDKLGPTASLNSVASLDHQRFGNGINLNLKFDTATLQGAKSSGLLEALVKSYFKKGGMQVQVNVLDAGLLQEAILHPERHRNLLVRISGYSAYFVDLTREMQQEIINRTLQGAD